MPVKVKSIRFLYVVALFAGFGFLYPIVGTYFGDHWPFTSMRSNWWILLYPGGLTLLGDTLKDDIDIDQRIAIAIGINGVLYAVVGAIVGGSFALVQRVRRISN